MAHTLRCTFLAQEWVGDTAYPVRRGNLRFKGAPQWAQEWDGPFEVDFELAVD